MIFHKFPWTNSHDINLDWFLRKWEEFLDGWRHVDADAVSVDYGTQPSVTVTGGSDDKPWHFSFRIPKAAILTGFITRYAGSSSGTVVPTVWSPTIPVVAQGDYLWTQVTMVYSDGQQSSVQFCSRMGIDGTGSVVSVNGIAPDDAGNVTLPLPSGADTAALASNAFTGSAGISSLYSRSDHRHPLDTSSRVAFAAQYGMAATATAAENTAALEAAMNAATIVIIPAGTYAVTGDITIPDGRHIIGCRGTILSSEDSTLTFSGSVVVDTLRLAVPSVVIGSQNRFTSVFFESRVDSDGKEHTTFVDCTFNNKPVLLQNGADINLIGCHINLAIVTLQTIIGSRVDSCLFYGSYAGNDSSLKIRNAADVNIANCKFSDWQVGSDQTGNLMAIDIITDCKVTVTGCEMRSSNKTTTVGVKLHTNGGLANVTGCIIEAWKPITAASNSAIVAVGNNWSASSADPDLTGSDSTLAGNRTV